MSLPLREKLAYQIYHFVDTTPEGQRRTRQDYLELVNKLLGLIDTEIHQLAEQDAGTEPDTEPDGYVTRDRRVTDLRRQPATR